MVELNVNYDELEEMDLEVAKKIITQFDCEHSLEDIGDEIDGIHYGIKVTNEGDWDDEGKYQLKEDIGILCEYDDWNIVKMFNIAVTQSMARTGSYYSDYYYGYDKLKVNKIIKKVIPRQIIEERTVVTLEQ